MQETRADNAQAIGLALLLHAVLFGLIFFGMWWTRSTTPPSAGEPVSAELFDPDSLSQSMRRELAQRPEPLAEPPPPPPAPEPEPLPEPLPEEVPPPPQPRRRSSAVPDRSSRTKRPRCDLRLTRARARGAASPGKIDHRARTQDEAERQKQQQPMEKERQKQQRTSVVSGKAEGRSSSRQRELKREEAAHAPKRGAGRAESAPTSGQSRRRFPTCWS